MPSIHSREFPWFAPPELRDEAEALCSMLTDPQIEAVYHRLLGSGGTVSPYESEYYPAGQEGMREKGVVLGDMAAFYKASAFVMSYLKLKETYAAMGNDRDAYRICRDAGDKFLNEHLLRWTPQFLERVVELGTHEFYDIAARLLGEFLERESALLESLS